jgi:hypothetical protein
MEPTPISGSLLDVRWEDNDLVLVLDKNYWPGAPLDPVPIVNLRLRTCVPEGQAVDYVARAIGEPVLCWLDDESAVARRLSVETADDQVWEFGCSTIDQAVTEYSPSQLWSRYEGLNSSFDELRNELIKTERHQGEFVHQLRSEANNELDRCHRKREFFQQSNPARLSEIEAQAKVWQRVVAVLEHLEKQKQDLD